MRGCRAERGEVSLPSFDTATSRGGAGRIHLNVPGGAESDCIANLRQTDYYGRYFTESEHGESVGCSIDVILPVIISSSAESSNAVIMTCNWPGACAGAICQHPRDHCNTMMR